ncbi:MAG: hypothetical protein CL470_08125 [Acidimicrobiaceae bacterium]|nr:hypothetical protein [Acidimicrobiaceae bacterium]
MKTKKRIYIICTSLNLGGSELQAVFLANFLAKNGYDVVFVSLKKAGELKEKLSDGVKLYDFMLYRKSKSKKLVKIRTLLWLLIGIKNLRKELKNSQGKNIIISFLFHASLVSFISSINIKSTKHIASIRSDRFTVRTKRISIPRTIVMRIIFRYCSHLVFNSVKSSDSFIKNKNNTKNFSIIHNFLSQNSAKIEDKKFKNGSTKGIYVGRLDKLKNIDSLLHAIRKLNNEGNEFSLDVYGGGKEEKHLEELVSKLGLDSQIKFKYKVLDVIQNSQNYDFLALTSFHEGFPNVIIEAMANYLPVISTPVGDVSYLIAEDRGIIINNTDVDSIYLALKRFKSLKAENRKKMAEDAYVFIKDYLDKDKISNQWIGLLRQI